jgi:hypothetical protein
LKVHASVHCNPVKPSRKRRFVAEETDVLKDLQENLLGQIFRIISVACEPVSEPKDRGYGKRERFAQTPRYRRADMPEPKQRQFPSSLSPQFRPQV